MTLNDRTDDQWWATMSPPVTTPTPKHSGPLRLAFYGRCSTEDIQDPETSLNWQMRAAKALAASLPMNTDIVATYFDIGESRSLPWKRRPQGARLLNDVRDPQRPWDAVIVGEGQRCWYGAQFADVSALFEHSNVTVFIPELGGAYDPVNPAHFTMMSLNGGMSRAERQRVQERVRLGMAVQVEFHGRFQGGRAPYGYTAVGYAPHPNPRKAAEGAQLKRLEVQEPEASVVRRIFEERLGGRSLRDIARRLNSDEVMSPSVASSEKTSSQWRLPTLRIILANGRYTGYEFWGRKTRKETLMNPDDPSWGNETKFVANDKPATRSRVRVHEPIIDLETFAKVQAITESKEAQGSSAPRIASVGAVVYPLRSVIGCGICGRSMGAERFGTKNDPQRPTDVRYRCRSRDLPLDHPSREAHPANVRINQSEVLDCLQGWFGRLLAPESRATVLAAMNAADESPSADTVRTAQARKRLTEAELRLSRLVSAIEEGFAPELIAPRINRLSKEISALRGELALTSATAPASHQSVNDILNRFAHAVDAVFGRDADYKELNEFFMAVNLHLEYNVRAETLSAQVSWSDSDSKAPSGLPTTHATWERLNGSWSIRDVER